MFGRLVQVLLPRSTRTVRDDPYTHDERRNGASCGTIRFHIQLLLVWYVLILVGGGTQNYGFAHSRCGSRRSAWFKSIKFAPDVADRAKQLLDRQREWSLTNLGCRPDYQSYAIVINTYARSNDPLRLQKATTLLKDMLEHIESGRMKASRNPTAPFTAVLGVVARMDYSSNSSSNNEFETAVDTQNDPYSIAQEVYHSIRADTSHVGATVDHFAVSAFLRCITRHCPQGTVERENATRMAFEDACASGQVSNVVIADLKAAIGDKKVNELYPELLKNARRPKSWSQNVAGRP